MTILPQKIVDLAEAVRENGGIQTVGLNGYDT